MIAVARRRIIQTRFRVTRGVKRARGRERKSPKVSRVSQIVVTRVVLLCLVLMLLLQSRGSRLGTGTVVSKRSFHLSSGRSSRAAIGTRRQQDPSTRIDEPVGNLRERETRHAAQRALFVFGRIWMTGVFEQPRLEQVRNGLGQFSSATRWRCDARRGSRWHVSRRDGHDAARSAHARHSSVRVHVAWIVRKVVAGTVRATVGNASVVRMSSATSHGSHTW